MGAVRNGATKLCAVLARIALHSVAAVLVGCIGLAVDSVVGLKFHSNVSLGPLSPLASTLPVVLAVFWARWRSDQCAQWAWVPALLWLAFGVHDMLYAGGVLQTGEWQGSTPYQFLIDNLLGAKCGDTECLDVLFFAFPFVSAAIYSVSAFVALKVIGRKGTRLSPHAN